ncbi:MAG: hypothetical protein ACREMR_12895 [Gemmatimonadales bacterium]
MMHPPVVALLALAVTAPTVAAQDDAAGTAPRAFIARVEVGSLSPNELFNATMALGAAAGVELKGRNAFLLRYTRQSQNRNSGDDLGARAREFVSVSWEHAFGDAERHAQQYMVRLAGGAIFRQPLTTVPFALFGVAIRYRIGERFAFVGAIEDAVAPLPEETAEACTDFGGCTEYPVGGSLQHNFGLMVAVEWKP